ncbi:cysteine desulfurase family protein [Chondrinema litorale]|uniref:cysteine desulfurase family protein n=1 Tax=Chondrinema litorale TaxID=2994555 RepID=UPI0025433920|nr:cysteine desulfurase family protein [Chondrinema litorale]UZR92376.1 cysteine desulfurase family protein [Chondrinema litorale]
MKVYLDNAATTSIDKRVLEEMLPFLENNFGNPSSTHSHGRVIKAAIEKSRKKVAELLHATPAEIIFTSGGTESDNTAIRSNVNTGKVKHIISSKLEHHAVLHTVEELERKGVVKATYIDFDDKGNLDLIQLEELLKDSKDVMVSLMHGNNEIGNILDIEKVSELCKEYGVIFHSDTVQTVGHFDINLSTLPINYIAASAHKFHGPKGVGILYMKKDSRTVPFITGGGQEREMRGGTENVYGIVGFAKALELALSDLENHRKHIESLKWRMIQQLQENIQGVEFHGNSGDVDNSLYTVLNVCLPESPANGMMLFNLDLASISASGGSACSSGALAGSHVINALRKGKNSEKGVIRFSFSKYNTTEEIDYTVSKLKEVLDSSKVVG